MEFLKLLAEVEDETLSRAVARFVADVNEHRDHLAAEILDGGTIATFEQYRSMCGEYSGLTAALTYLENALKGEEDDGED